MRDIIYSTANESKMIKAIQRAVGALDNGVIGCQTLSDLAIKFKCDCFPLTLMIYGCPTIIANDIIACDPDSSVKPYENSISGSFTYPSSGKPCSILINKGRDIFSSACHAFLGKPEGVIARYNDGSYWFGRCKTTSEIPNRKDVRWAIGGLMLGKEYNPTIEGFSGAYSDVLRKTNHTVLGVKNGMCYLIYVPNTTATSINIMAKDKFKFDCAIMLDGGHIAAINGTETFAEINMNQYQGYVIQGV